MGAYGEAGKLPSVRCRSTSHWAAVDIVAVPEGRTSSAAAAAGAVPSVNPAALARPPSGVRKRSQTSGDVTDAGVV